MAIPTIESIEEKIATATAIQDGVVDAKNSAADAANRAEEVLANAAKLDGDNIFTGSDAFTGPVDLSAADLTLPADAIPGAVLTQEQVDLLATYASSEGRNITPASDGLFATQIGHTYVVTAGDTEVTVISGSDLSFVVLKNAQQGFVAPTATATVSTTDCTITEVFKPAAPIELSSVGSGDYLTYDENGVVTGGRLDNVTNTSYWQYNNSTLKDWTIDMPNVVNASSMFMQSKIERFTGNLSSLKTASSMFWSVRTLKEFNVSALPNLKTADAMFQSAGIVEWHIDLPALTSGIQMFYGVGGLTSFTGALPALATGTSMFHDTRFKAFESDLPSLTNGTTMFNYCIKLALFSGALPALTNGKNMFGSSSSNCTRLDLASIQRIAETINDLAAAGKTGSISLGMQSALQSDDATAEINVALAAIRAKGWTVTEIYRA